MTPILLPENDDASLPDRIAIDEQLVEVHARASALPIVVQAVPRHRMHAGLASSGDEQANPSSTDVVDRQRHLPCRRERECNRDDASQSRIGLWLTELDPCAVPMPPTDIYETRNV